MSSFFNEPIVVPPEGKVDLEAKQRPIGEMEPPYESHYAFTRGILSDAYIQAWKKKLGSMSIDAWNDENQTGNVKVVRPSHDAWGIKKIVFNFCDDFLLKVLDFPWGMTEEWRSLLVPVYKAAGVDESKVVRCLLASMPAGVEIPVHHDTGYWVKHTHRVHMAITTGPEVEFRVGPTEELMQNYLFDEGRIVELNNQAKHAVANRMPEGRSRVHLIFDYVDQHPIKQRVALRPGEVLFQTRRSIEVAGEVAQAQAREQEQGELRAAAASIQAPSSSGGSDVKRIGGPLSLRAPAFIIIGAQKCGTTSMYEYLCQHPLVARGKRRETHYFDWRFNHSLGELPDIPLPSTPPDASGAKVTALAAADPQYEELVKSHYDYYLNFYEANALKKHRSIFTGESTPSYLLHSDIVIPRMRCVCPWAKLIVMLRDPVERAYSQYNMCIDPEGTPEQLRVRGESAYAHQSFEQAVREEIAELQRLEISPDCPYERFRSEVPARAKVPWASPPPLESSGMGEGGMAAAGPKGDCLQVFVGYTMLVLLEGALVWNLYAEWLPDPSRAPNPSCEKHLQFAVHSFLAMLLTGGVLTYLFSDIDWQDTPLTRHYGYNDITVVLEYSPSIYVMPAYWLVTAAGFHLYVLEDTKRLLRLNEGHPGMNFSYVVNAVLAVTVILFSLTLAIRADQDIAAHTFPALLLVMVLPLPFIMQAFEVVWKRTELQRPDRSYGLLIICVSWFAVVSFLKVCLSLFALGVRPIGPSFAKPLDGFWLFLALIVPFLLHPAPGGAYQQLPGAETTTPRPGTPTNAASSTKYLATVCAGLSLLAVAGIAYAAYAKNPAFSMEASGPTRQSAVGYEAVRHSRHCADRGERCHCPGGFVLFGRGRLQSFFSSSLPFARWDVYPTRVQDSILCDEAALGDPFIFTDSEECRCVESGLRCEQVSEGTAGGCGTGSSAFLLEMGAGTEEMRCCNNHDRCYGLCGHTKQQCDADFDRCLEGACGRSAGSVGRAACQRNAGRMKQAVRARASEAAFSEAERGRQRWVLAESSPEEPRPGNASSTFNCRSGEDLWQLEWSEAKKSWCCQHEGRGCAPLPPPRPATTAPPGAPRSTTAAARTTTRAPTTAAASTTTARRPAEASRRPPATTAPQRKRPPATTLPRRPKPHKPFNCLTTDEWPADKKVWCCANVGLGCEESGRSPLRLLSAGPSVRGSGAWRGNASFAGAGRLAS